MKKITSIIFSFLTLSLYMSSAQAACDFVIDIGDKKTKIVEKFAEPMPMFAGQLMLPVPSIDVCPNDNLDMDIAVEYIFLGDPEDARLAAIRMIVLNDGKNTISDQLTLMNYAKKVYGDFDTGHNPKIYNNFQAWEKTNKLIIYKRIFNEENLIEEEVFITNNEYNQKLGEFYNKIEIEEAKLEEENS